MKKEDPNVEEQEIISLTPDLIRIYAQDICTSLDQIHGVDPHTEEYLLQERRGDRFLYKKWEHSFIMLAKELFVGIIFGYERKSEDSEQCPYNAIYLSDLAVKKELQGNGFGRQLIQTWLDRNTAIGFLVLDGPLRFMVQTNSAPWNQNVRRLYESFGFKKISEKAYDNRTDIVYLLEVEG